MQDKSFLILAAGVGVLGYGLNKFNQEKEGTSMVSQIRSVGRIFSTLATWCSATSSVVSLVNNKSSMPTWGLNTVNEWSEYLDCKIT